MLELCVTDCEVARRVLPPWVRIGADRGIAKDAEGCDTASEGPLEIPANGKNFSKEGSKQVEYRV